jgi:hypothetical protein
MWQWRRVGNSRTTWVVRALVSCAALVVSLVVVPASPVSAQAAPNAGGEYTPVAPFRVFDSRPTSNVGGFVGPVRGQQAITAQVAGVPGSGIPATGALAVAMNVTIVSPTTPAFLTVWPAGSAMPLASNLNFSPGEVLPNLVVSAVGSGGRVGVFINAGAAHVVIDVVGWYATSAVTQRGARLVPVSPARILDTRINQGAVGPVGQGGTINLRVRGMGGVPTSNVTGVVLNVTATGPTAGTFVTVYPDDIARPLASNLNLTPGMTRPNLVMVKVGANGGVNLFNLAGSVHLVADVVGYYQTGAPMGTFAGRVIPLSTPFRAFDTRDYATRLGPQQREAWNFQPFVSSLNSGGSTVGPVSGLIMNVTSTAVSANSYLTMFPDSQAGVPLASTLNPVANQSIPNLAVVALPAGGAKANHIAAYNNSGFLHYLADVTAVILAD